MYVCMSVGIGLSILEAGMDASSGIWRTFTNYNVRARINMKLNMLKFMRPSEGNQKSIGEAPNTTPKPWEPAPVASNY